MSDPQVFAVRTVGQWQSQARDAWERLNAARERQGLPEDLPLADLDKLDHQAFCLLIEALYALGPERSGVTISQELLDRAEMRPVSEVILSD